MSRLELALEVYKQFIFKALEWDEAFKKNADKSGRAVFLIHNYALKKILLEVDKIKDESFKVYNRY